MIVTVQETVERSRDITAEMVQAYILRKGWRMCYDGPSCKSWTPHADRSYPCVSLPQFQIDLTGIVLRNEVIRIALIEGRKPHEVLADIAEGR